MSKFVSMSRIIKDSDNLDSKSISVVRLFSLDNLWLLKCIFKLEKCMFLPLDMFVERYFYLTTSNLLSIAIISSKVWLLCWRQVKIHYKWWPWIEMLYKVLVELSMFL